MESKPFKTLDEQIEILKSRGLIINDENFARDFLLKNNYYRISGYSLTLRNNDVFYPETSFQNIVDIYSCDHDLRHILLNYIEIIEVKIKSIYSYEFSQIYGPLGFFNQDNFTNPERYSKILVKGEEQKVKRLPNEAYLKHFIHDLNQQVPFWAYVDLLTISDISILYSISKPELKVSVAKLLGMKSTNSPKILATMLHNVTIIRNLCAHGSRLFNRLFEQKPTLSRAERSLLIQNKDGTVDNAHLYGFILVMRRLLEPSDYKNLYSNLQSLSDRYSYVDMRHYGFRYDWKKQLQPKEITRAKKNINTDN